MKRKHYRNVGIQYIQPLPYIIQYLNDKKLPCTFPRILFSAWYCTIGTAQWYSDGHTGQAWYKIWQNPNYFYGKTSHMWCLTKQTKIMTVRYKLYLENIFIVVGASWHAIVRQGLKIQTRRTIRTRRGINSDDSYLNFIAEIVFLLLLLAENYLDNVRM